MKETGDGGQETGGSDVGLRSPVFGLRSSVLTPLKSVRSSAGLNLVRCLVSAVPLLVVLGFASVGQAVGVVPRISDREIIESLVELKVGQQALQLGLDIPVIKGVVIEEQDVEVGLTSREYWP